MEKEKREALALFFSEIEGIGGGSMRKLLREFGDEEVIFGLKEAEIQKTLLLTEKQKYNILESRKRGDVWKAYARIRDKGISLTVLGDEKYPRRLCEIQNPPYVLFYEGELPEDNLPAVAIIGARSCTNYGRYAAELFAGELAKRDINIISGLASGIDGIAQREALRVGGKSFGILGCGTDVCYPAGNRGLYEDLKHKGGILSEYSPGTKPESFHFPMRNRIISGLSDLILVIEAKEKSGTAITVSTALEQGKDVYAVPGRIGEPLSEGCNRLIADGAGVALNPEVILEELVGRYKENFDIKPAEKISSQYAGVQDDIVKFLRETGRNSAETVAQQTKMDISKVIMKLAELELEDVVICSGGFYELRNP